MSGFRSAGHRRGTAAVHFARWHAAQAGGAAYPPHAGGCRVHRRVPAHLPLLCDVTRVVVPAHATLPHAAAAQQLQRRQGSVRTPRCSVFAVRSCDSDADTIPCCSLALLFWSAASGKSTSSPYACASSTHSRHGSTGTTCKTLCRTVRCSPLSSTLVTSRTRQPMARRWTWPSTWCVLLWNPVHILLGLRWRLHRAHFHGLVA